MPPVEAHEQPEMSFVEHLEVLRWHLIRSVIAIVLFTVIGFVFTDFIVNTLILGPSKADFWTYRWFCELGRLVANDSLCIEQVPFTIINRGMAGQFTMHIIICLSFGFILGFPYAFWEIWRFVRPGLHVSEQLVTRGAVLVVSFLFLSGISFGYLIIAPLSINFLANYQLSASIANQIDLTSYIETLLTLVLATGVMFQLPVVVYFMSKIGVLTPDIMREYRRHSILGILFVAAIITPPDVFSQILVTLPVYLLYEVSIFVSASVVKNAERQA